MYKVAPYPTRIFIKWKTFFNKAPWEISLDRFDWNLLLDGMWFDFSFQYVKLDKKCLTIKRQISRICNKFGCFIDWHTKDNHIPFTQSNTRNLLHKFSNLLHKLLKFRKLLCLLGFHMLSEKVYYHYLLLLFNRWKEIE